MGSDADAMWVYVDQGENYKNAGCIVHDPVKRSTSLDWDCAKWAGFGKKFAFVQTGQLGHAINGTTLAVSKKGSSLNDIINPCMDRFMQTEEYYKVRAQYVEGSSRNKMFMTWYMATVVRDTRNPRKASWNSVGCIPGIRHTLPALLDME